MEPNKLKSEQGSVSETLMLRRGHCFTLFTGTLVGPLYNYGNCPTLFYLMPSGGQGGHLNRMECNCTADLISAFVSLLGFGVTIITLSKGIRQHRENSLFNRATYFLKLRSRFKSDPRFNAIRMAFMNGENLEEFSQIDIYDYAGFFEDIKIAIDSGFVSPKMAAYLFGYYITEFDDAIVNSTVFHRDAPLWSKYRGLVEQMRSELDNNNFNNLEF